MSQHSQFRLFDASHFDALTRFLCTFNNNVRGISVLLAITIFNAAFPAYAEETWEAGARKADQAYWTAYNGRNAQAMNALLADDVEFYHDLGGPTIGKNTLAATNEGMMTSPAKLRREEIPGTVQFYPMKKDGEIYGALVQGEHQFRVTPADKPEFLADKASFIHLMRLENGEWKIARIFSYLHVSTNAEKK